MTTEAQLRIGDADRDRAAAALGEHYAQGRLSTAEHAERLDAIWAARTRADLAPVFRDLPGAEPTRSRPGALPPRRWRRGPARPPRLLLALLVLLVVLTVVTHLPFVLLLVGAVLFVAARRHRRSGGLRTG